MDSTTVKIKTLYTENYRLWINEKFEKAVYELLNTTKPESFIKIGEVIKQSHKAISCRVESFFLKITNFSFFEGFLRHQFLRHRCRNGWFISLIATQFGIPISTPVFYLETLYHGLPWQSIFASEYICNSKNVEIFARNLSERNLTKELISLLTKISDVTSSLWHHNLYHRDLSGKNILTVDGNKVYLVDLDSVKILKNISLRYKIKNLTQIYDSFCDYVEDEILKNCIYSLLPEYDLDAKKEIYQSVKKLQMSRRTKHLYNLRKRTKIW